MVSVNKKWNQMEGLIFHVIEEIGEINLLDLEFL